MRIPTSRFLAALLPVLVLALPPAAAAQRSTPPPVAPPKNLKLPEKREFTLSNGMAVTLVPYGTVPKAAVSLAVRTGRIDQGANEVWLAETTADLMMEGTESRPAARLAEEVAGMGGQISVSAGSDLTNVGGEVLGEHAAAMVRLVADVVRNPLLPESELGRIKASRLRSLSIARSQPQPIAQEKFLELIYGDHPYGRLYPTEAMLQGYTIDQVRQFHARNFGAARAHLYVAGVFDAAAVERAVREAFGDWAPGNPATAKPPAPKTGRSVALIDRPDAVQSTLILGLPVPDPTDRNYVALEVTDALLGGAFGSRITRNIREDKGYTYSPFSSVADYYQVSHWSQQADVTTNVTGASLKEIFHEIDSLRAVPPPAEELTGIKNNLAGIFTLQNSSRGGIVGMLRWVDLQGLDDNYLPTYVQRVLAVTPADVQRIAREHLRPELMPIVVVGDRKTVAEQVAPYERGTP
ncbi:MAG TPA: pitrilysin family protein [Gemmatimonadales bacterium]|nr:pitrilysin family protein [Gemmatimonadales bacterium]